MARVKLEETNECNDVVEMIKKCGDRWEQHEHQ
jgi:hypothetical protein